MTPNRIVLIDDHRAFAEALALAVESTGEFQVVGIAMNGDDGARLAVEAHPSLLLVDVDCPGRSVFEVVDELKHRDQSPKCVVLSAHCTDSLLEQAIRARVDGYLLKTDSVAAIIGSLRSVLATGAAQFSTPVQERLTAGPGGRVQVKEATLLSGLSSRQIEVLRHLAAGKSVKEVAKLMHLSAKTVDSHKYRIMRQLDIHDRVELAHFARKAGLLIDQ